ncbi:MAG TPA: TonB family protein [Xanthobacteraceae bacterium]|jgi:TonB family protein
MFDHDSPKHSSRALWITAALGAGAIHAGCVVLALASNPPDDPPDLGARAIEIGVELAAPHIDQSERPIGPDSEAAAPSPAQVEQKAVVEQTDLPKAIPTETDDPDRVVTPNDTPKPVEEEPKITTVETVASVASAASEETATPSIEKAPEAPTSVAPALGTGESAQRARVTWQKELAAHLDRYKRYPADRSTQTAEVVISFILDRSGRVLSTRVLKGSGDSSFDAAALAMLQRADPVPPPPPLVADEGLTFTLPVVFHVKVRG